MVKEHDYIKEIDKYVGGKIFFLRTDKNLPRKQLANEIGVSEQQLKKYEDGKNRMSIGRLILIANALNTNAEYFYKVPMDILFSKSKKGKLYGI
jgi:transcriptional regulator with XRE-family HTH domain